MTKYWKELILAVLVFVILAEVVFYSGLFDITSRVSDPEINRISFNQMPDNEDIAPFGINQQKQKHYNNIQRNASFDERINARRLPQVLVIGVQKCGTGQSVLAI